MTTYVPPEAMTGTQLEKRARALHSVVDLVAEQGLDNVNMKAVAAHSGVALGTLYRFFTTKDHLFAAALVEWQAPLVAQREQAARSEQPGTVTERVFAYIRSGTRAFQRSPKLLGLLVYASTSTDGFASEAMIEVRRNNAGGLVATMPEVAVEYRHTAADVLESVWFDALVEWHTGRRTLTQSLDLLRQAVALVVGPVSGSAP